MRWSVYAITAAAVITADDILCLVGLSFDAAVTAPSLPPEVHLRARQVGEGEPQGRDSQGSQRSSTAAPEAPAGGDTAGA
jgi:hypothetical protein